ncbi:MAG: 5'/3'-nucleotidase SurE [Brevundimonas sp.]|uniref:5'-nucleotidase SurE n=1 Tax=Brevundimonas albigilva TaxID=1312364 RepID=A0ABY4SU26_9CAUL|nr:MULTISPECIES: 5'/3'-nucleotidase SurE [Brevundimonas]PZU58292.1 MAG: 5'/3'-nucleotidase SurE [Brevundimonas sp.]UQV18615.1 5'/3'-nucleotidase SurE [Brevundimonas albigilva]URI16614.1 5'/3'-nucleotidase SurE [Brevundimonas albigilva]
MRILLTNDDGIEAEGLECLEKIARTLTDDVWVCAPAVEQSGKGRGITLTEPLRVNRLGDKRFAVTGTPTDCVVLAVNDLMPEKPDLVLSGVNRGHNIGEDVSYSGTVAGALQGMAFGIRSIALSQSLERFHDEVIAHWETAEAFAPAIISRLLDQKWQPGVVMNLNFPNRRPEQVEAVEVTTQGFRDVGEMHAVRRTDLRGRDYYWMSFRGQKQEHAEGTDLRAIDEGRISVTPLHIDLTHMASVNDLKKVLGGAPPRKVERVA